MNLEKLRWILRSWDEFREVEINIESWDEFREVEMNLDKLRWI